MSRRIFFIIISLLSTSLVHAQSSLFKKLSPKERSSNPLERIEFVQSLTKANHLKTEETVIKQVLDSIVALDFDMTLNEWRQSSILKCSFNENGLLNYYSIRYLDTSIFDNSEYGSFYFYDSQKRVSEEHFFSNNYDGDTIQKSKSLYSYNVDELIIEDFEFDSLSQSYMFDRQFTYELNNQGMIISYIEQLMEIDSNVLRVVRADEYFYNEDDELNEIVSLTDYTNRGFLDTNFIFLVSYNTEGRVAQTSTYEIDFAGRKYVSDSAVFTYDNEGRHLEYLTESYRENHQYDNNGFLNIISNFYRGGLLEDWTMEYEETFHYNTEFENHELLLPFTVGTILYPGIKTLSGNYFSEQYYWESLFHHRLDSVSEVYNNSDGQLENYKSLLFYSDLPITGTNENIERTSNLVQVYPNPANSYIQFHSNLDLRVTQIEIINVLGEVMLSNQLENDRLDIGVLTPGIYTYLISSRTHNTQTGKILIE